MMSARWLRKRGATLETPVLAHALIQGLKDGHYCVNNAIVQARAAGGSPVRRAPPKVSREAVVR